MKTGEHGSKTREQQDRTAGEQDRGIGEHGSRTGEHWNRSGEQENREQENKKEINRTGKQEITSSRLRDCSVDVPCAGDGCGGQLWSALIQLWSPLTQG